MELIIPKVAYALQHGDRFHLPDNMYNTGTVCGLERHKYIPNISTSRRLLRDLTEDECCSVCFAAFARPPFNPGADKKHTIKEFIESLDVPPK